MFGSRLSRQRLTVDLFTPATFAMVVVPISAIRLCNQLSILRASVLLRAVELSICDTSSVLFERPPVRRHWFYSLEARKKPAWPQKGSRQLNELAWAFDPDSTAE
jgi:hypothetical protein